MNPGTAKEELKNFVTTLARAGISTAMVPLDVFVEWSMAAPIHPEDHTGPYFSFAGGAIVIRPIPTAEIKTFENAEEVAVFIEKGHGNI